MNTISVKQWERFQHYKDRDPPWIKMYRDMLTSESWVLGTDCSRLVQVAITLLAARYGNEVPYRFELIRKVAHLDCSEQQFKKAIELLVQSDFLEIHGVTNEEKEPEQLASTLIAKCSSETEQSRAETEQSRDRDMSGTEPPDDVLIVFDHWKNTHRHPKAALDPKRRKLIAQALKIHPPETLCQSITGYLKSAFHQGQNDKNTVYDSIEIMLRDSQHIDAGLKFYEGDPLNGHSTLTRKNIASTAGWVPPEIRNAKH